MRPVAARAMRRAACTISVLELPKRMVSAQPRTDSTRSAASISWVCVAAKMTPWRCAATTFSRTRGGA